MRIDEFILARVAEDERAAERGRRHNDVGTYANDNYGCLLVGPARVLAECEAKRRIVELAGEASSDRYAVIGEFCVGREETDEAMATDPGEMILRSLATVYVEHPGYDPEWRLP